MFSARVAAVKCRPVLHHCVVLFFWSSGIMECTCMLLTFENAVNTDGKKTHKKLPYIFVYIYIYISLNLMKLHVLFYVDLDV